MQILLTPDALPLVGWHKDVFALVLANFSRERHNRAVLSDGRDFTYWDEIIHPMKYFPPVSQGVLLAIAAALGLLPSARAVIVADYQFTAGSNANSAASGIATASTISVAPGSISTTTSQFFISNSGNAIPESLDSSLSNNNFLSFSVTPMEANLSFSSLTFGFGLTNNTSTVNPYTGNWAVFSSISGFTSGSQIAAGSFSLPTGSGTAIVFANPAPEVALSGVSGLQNVAGPVEFRIYYWDNSSVAVSNLVLRMDNIQLNASTVPEPGALALFGLGFGLVGWTLRRRGETSTSSCGSGSFR